MFYHEFVSVERMVMISLVISSARWLFRHETSHFDNLRIPDLYVAVNLVFLIKSCHQYPMIQISCRILVLTDGNC